MQGKISTTMFRVPLWVMNRQSKKAKSRVHLNAAFEMESRKQAGALPADSSGGNDPGMASGAAVPRDSGVALGDVGPKAGGAEVERIALQAVLSRAALPRWERAL